MIPSWNKLERFFAPWEFTAEHILCASDVEGRSLRSLLDMADENALAQWRGLELGYTETAGHPDLRAAIAALYRGVAPEEVVVCGGGAVEAILHVLNGLLAPGGHAVVVGPAFEPLHKVASAAGADVTIVSLDAAKGWSLDLGAVAAGIRPDTRALVVNFPHNPTGAIPGADVFRELVALADRRGITVVSDEVYRFMEFDPGRRLPAAAELSDRAVSIGVMSKAYGLAGLRIGWAVAKDRDLLRQVTATKDFTSVCASAPAEILALIALRNHERVVEGCRQLVLENLRHVDAFFERWDGLFAWHRPQGGAVGFPLLNSPVPVDLFVQELVEREGVLLLPASVFDHPENHFRIGLGRRSLPEALERFDRFLEKRPL